MLPRLASYLSFALSSGVAGSLLLPRLDFVMVESPPLVLGISGCWLSWVRRARLIFNVSDLWPASAANLGVIAPTGIAYRVASRLEAACYRWAWLVTGQSREIVADVSSRFPECRTYYLPNAVDTGLFHPGRASASVRARLAPDSSCIALYAGLHGLAQGLSLVLDAAELVGSSVGVVFVGDGPEKPALQRDAARRALTHVAFHEPVPRPAMPETVASADILLVPLRTHIPGAVPSKLYEAMACGRPVILVAEGEACDIVRKWDAGLVVRPGDISGLVTALRRLADDPGLRARLGANGRRGAEEELDRHTIGTRFIDYLESAL